MHLSPDITARIAAAIRLCNTTPIDPNPSEAKISSLMSDIAMIAGSFSPTTISYHLPAVYHNHPGVLTVNSLLRWMALVIAPLAQHPTSTQLRDLATAIILGDFKHG